MDLGLVVPSPGSACPDEGPPKTVLVTSQVVRYLGYPSACWARLWMTIKQPGRLGSTVAPKKLGCGRSASPGSVSVIEISVPSISAKGVYFGSWLLLYMVDNAAQRTTQFLDFRLGSCSESNYSTAQVLPLALSIAILICLAVLFAACIFSSSLQALYLVKVNISEFPTVDDLTIARSFDDRCDALDLPTTVQDIAQGLPGSAGTTAGQVGSHYFAVGLWGYCEGSHDVDIFSNCIKPSVSFSFDLVVILGDRLGKIDGLLPESSQSGLRKYHQTTTVFIVGASASMTAIYGILVAGIQSMLQPVGIHAGLGSQMLVVIWLAVGFSIASALVWAVGA
ncbi:hypothetical protein FE257_001456 [Aspergillus nanangensis]|uniref:Uncharacterized protein n=1 Tax=Aspergillus nanangensis TaxID=2582783 RepID=A0AAD4CE12_ASPNN|nr:hypothetical protein FE257_001456 [Aspergillus nanangensis]